MMHSEKLPVRVLSRRAARTALTVSERKFRVIREIRGKFFPETEAMRKREEKG